MPVLLVLALSALSLAGCGGEPPTPIEDEATAGPTVTIVEMDRELGLQEQEHEADLAAQAARLERTMREENEARIEGLEHALAQARARIEQLERDLVLRTREVASLKQSAADAPPKPAIPPPRVSAFEPPVPSTHRAREDAGFPLAVFDVVGRQAVSGSHTSMRFTTKELAGPGLDFPRKVRTQESYEVDEYTYEVAFSAENLTDRALTFSMRAGSLSRTAHLEARETRTNLTISAMMGAPLIITTEAHRRRFPVEPSEPVPGD